MLGDALGFLGVARGEDPAQMKFHGYPDIFLESGPIRKALERYLDWMGCEHSLLAPLLFMWWVQQLQDWAPLQLYHPEWRRLRVFPVIARWAQALDRELATSAR